MTETTGAKKTGGVKTIAIIAGVVALAVAGVAIVIGDGARVKVRRGFGDATGEAGDGGGDAGEEGSWFARTFGGDGAAGGDEGAKKLLRAEDAPKSVEERDEERGRCTVTGTVVWSDTRFELLDPARLMAPAEDVTVFEDRGVRRGRIRGVQTDGAGVFSLAGLNPGRVTVAAKGSRGMHLARQTVTLDEKCVADAVVKLALLRENLVVAGVVVDGFEKPVARARLTLVEGSTRGLVKPIAGATDAEGRFRFENLGAGVFSVRAEASGFADGEVKGIAAGKEDVKVVLERSATLLGRVELPNGQPPKKYEVTVENGAAHVTFTREFRKRDGSFRFKDLATGSWKVTARANHEGRTWLGERTGVAVGEGAAVEDVVVTLASSATLLVELRGKEANLPVAGATVGVVAASGGGGPRTGNYVATGTARGEGVAKVTGVPKGVWYARVVAPGYLPAETERFTVSSGEEEVRLTVELTPGDYGEMMRKTQFGGIGATIKAGRGKVAVHGVLPGSPAANAGLQPGDEIVMIDFEPAAGKSVEEALAAIRGDERKPVTLDIVRGGERKRVSIVREQINIER